MTWEEIEQNRSETLGRNRGAIEPETFGQTIGEALALSGVAAELSRVSRSESDALAKRCTRLRNELKRGREYWEQVQAELAETRALLEKWPVYERQCGRNPLPQLAQKISANKQIVEFLGDWLNRMEAQFLAASQELESLRNNPLPPNANGTTLPSGA